MSSHSILLSLVQSLHSPISGLSLGLQLVVATLLPLALWSSYNRFLHPLADIPGPVSVRLGFPFWRAYHAYKEDYVWALHQQHKLHGKFVRISPSHISISDPSAISQVYSHGLGSSFTKTSFYHSFVAKGGKPSLFSDIDPSSHSERRRAVASVYTLNNLVKLEEFVEGCIETLIKRFDERVGEGMPGFKKDSKEGQEQIAVEKKAVLDFTSWAHFFAMDAVGEIAFGSSFNLLENGCDPAQFLKGVSNLSDWGAIAGCLTSVSGLIQFLLAKFKKEPGSEVVTEKTWELLNSRYEQVEAGIETETCRSDMVTRFMKSTHPTTGKPYSKSEVHAVSTSVIAAGSDTTSVALSSFFCQVLSNPKVYSKLETEIEEAVQQGKLSLPIRYSQGVKLDYLSACLKESLRLHPPISMELPRNLPKQGAVIAGRYFPKGVSVGISPFVVHRQEASFGSDAEVFRPERWLEAEENEKKRMDRCFFSFGGGSRACIGKNISLMELHKVIPSLLIQYRFELSPRGVGGGPHQHPPRGLENGSSLKEPEPEPWNCRSPGWFLTPRDLWVQIYPRQDHW